jgi:hypothetical protein
MSRTHREFVDSREGFDATDEMFSMEMMEDGDREPTAADMAEAAENEPTMADYIEMDRMFCEMDEDDGQPDMQQEYEDLYGYGPEYDQSEYGYYE